MYLCTCTLYDWYLLATRKNVYPDSPLLCQKALAIAELIVLEVIANKLGLLRRGERVLVAKLAK